MTRIQILGAGCAKCSQLATATQAAATRLGLTFEIEKITDYARFAEYGVMLTPALVVDGKLKAAGRIPTNVELEQMLRP